MDAAILVRSSKGDSAYLVRYLPNGTPAYCECKGWRYRRRCRHLDVAAMVIPYP